MNSMSHTKTSFKRITAILLCLVSIFALASCGSVQMEQKQIFAMDTELAAKMQFFQLVQRICDISDVIEDIADKIQIMLIARKA